MDERKKASGGAAVVVVILALALPVLYVLSLGPISWLFTRGYLSDELSASCRMIYSPLEGVCKSSPLIEQPIMGTSNCGWQKI